jgi:hypothetical protein
MRGTFDVGQGLGSITEKRFLARASSTPLSAVESRATSLEMFGQRGEIGRVCPRAANT